DQVMPAVGSCQRSCGRESQRFVLRSETGRPGPLALARKAFQIPRSAVRPGPPLAEKGPASVCRRSSTPPDSETLIPPRLGPLTRCQGGVYEDRQTAARTGRARAPSKDRAPARGGTRDRASACCPGARDPGVSIPAWRFWRVVGYEG